MTHDESQFVRLAEDRLACSWCGIKLPEGSEETTSVLIHGGISTPAWHEPMGCCADCEPWQQYAEALARHPGMHHLGPAGAEVQATRIAKVCRVLDVDPPHVECATVELTAWIAALDGTAVPSWASFIQGAGMQFRASCCTTPWGFVTQQDRARLRGVLAHVLAERIASSAPAVRIAPPTIEAGFGETAAMGGCLVCGVDHISAPALDVLHEGGPDRAARTHWAPHSFDTGRHGQRMSGYTCPECEASFITAGRAWGPTFFDVALAEHLNIATAPIIADVVRLDARPWWRSGEPPSPVPWSHIGTPGELAQLRAELIADGMASADHRTDDEVEHGFATIFASERIR